MHYNGMSLCGDVREAYRSAERLAQRSGRRHRIHRVRFVFAGTPMVGWHICEVGFCNRDEATP